MSADLSTPAGSSFHFLMLANGVRPGFSLVLRMHRAQAADVDQELLAFAV